MLITHTQAQTHATVVSVHVFSLVNKECGMQIDLTKSAEDEDQSFGTKFLMSGDVHACWYI